MMMKKTLPLFLAMAVIAVTAVVSCTKEYSLENGMDGSDLIVGSDCRISKIASIDTPTNIGLGSIYATINSLDQVTDITGYDSLSGTIVTNAQPTYKGDTIYVNPDEYFVTDPLNSKRVLKFHRLSDPLDPTSAQVDVDFTYNTNGNLIQKSYQSAAFPVNPLYTVTYTYVGGNLDSMTISDLSVPEVITTAKLNYYSNIAPKNYMYLFPDESEPEYAQFNQFFNFGKRSLNAIKNLRVVDYIGGVASTDTTKATFGTYIMSRDNYVLSVILSGDDLPFLPAQKGTLKFSYKCK